MNAPLRIAKPACLAQPLPRVALLEASAGTGKTYAIERLVVEFLLEHRLSIADLLVVTFTRKAAAEMAERIRACLESLLATTTGDASPGAAAWALDDEARGRVRDALARFEEARISTIHRFCQSVLDEQSVLSGYVRDPASPAPADLLHDAFASHLRVVAASPSPAREVLAEWVRLGDKIASLEELLTEAAGHVRDPADVLGPFAPRVDEGMLAAAHEKLRAHATALPPLTKKALAADFLGKLDKYDPRYVQGALANIWALLQDDSRNALSPLAWQLHFLDAIRPIRGEAVLRDPAKFYGGETLGWLLHLQDVFRACPTEEAAAVHVFLPPVFGVYDAACRRRGAMDFQRLLLATRDALRADEGGLLRARLRGRHRAVLVDEFQDTDEVQWEILRTLFVDAPADTRFVAVGDPKQAIYSFRGGDFETYRAAQTLIHGLGEMPSSTRLRVNFRSTPAMVAGYNRVLSETVGARKKEDFFLTEQGGSVYDESNRVSSADRAPLLVDAASTRGRVLPPFVLLRCHQGSAAPVPEHQRALLREQEWPMHPAMVDEASRLIAGGAFLRHPDGTHEPIAPRHLMFLVRTNAQARELVGALNARGVHAELYRADGLLQGLEASEICDLLEALADPKHPSSLRKALRAAPFEVPFAELEQSEALGPGDPRLKLWQRCVRAAERRDWSALFGLLGRGMHAARRAAFSPAQERRAITMQAVLHSYQQMARQRCPDIATLARRARARLDHEPEEGQEVDDNHFPSATEGEAARVLTVYKAKGLEAPIVFLALDNGTDRATKRCRVFHDDATAERRVWLGSTENVPENALVALEEDLERRRRQYVALTRAGQRLYLPLWSKNPSASEAAKGRVGPVDASVSTRHYEVIHERLWKLAQDPAFLAECCEERSVYEFLPVDDAPLPPAPPAPPAPVPTAIDAAPAYARARGLALDSFSSLKNRLDPPGAGHLAASAPPAPPAPVTPEQMPRGATAGTILHLLMEQAPLASVAPGQAFEAWRARPDVSPWLEAFWRYSRWSAAQRGDAERMAHAGLHVAPLLSSLAELPGLPGLPGLPAFGMLPLAREVDFLMPWPAGEEGLPAALGGAGASGGDTPRRWRLEHGLLKGSIDFAFEFGGRVYFGDWKSNALAGYGSDAVRANVLQNYRRQVEIYTLALCRLYGIHDEATYQARFGAALYVYLRGYTDTGEGIAALRPAFDDIRALEATLASLGEHAAQPAGADPDPDRGPDRGPSGAPDGGDVRHDEGIADLRDDDDEADAAPGADEPGLEHLQSLPVQPGGTDPSSWALEEATP